MAMWNRCAICGRAIPVGELCYGIKNWRGDPIDGDTICRDCLVPENAPILTPPNEPRMINADKLAKRIAGHSNYHGDSILSAIYCAAEGKENDAPIRSIENPPNEPLTLEQLREMNGEPVWVRCLKPNKYLNPPVGWRILEKSILGTFGVWNGDNGLIEHYYGTDWIAYRRPPEGDEDV